MNNKIIALITAASLSITSYAEDIPALSIKTKSDSTFIYLKDISKIRYTETCMIVLLEDGSERTIDMDVIQSMNFCDIDENILLPTALF